MDNSYNVSPGMVVEYSYKLYNEADGKLLFETPAGKPDQMIYGMSPEVVPGLAAAMEGLKAGDRFGVTLPPEAAFGERHDDNVIELDREIFSRDGQLAEEVKEGELLPMMTAEGYRVTGTVLKIGDKDIKMDFNHPFAGLPVRYDGEVVSVRPATEAEISAVSSGGCSGCGGGCCGGDSGCGGESGCGGCDS